MCTVKKLIFDADDTLWDNNKFYLDATESFFDLCVAAGYDKNKVVNTFYDFELKVVNEKGYGSENFLYIVDHLFSYFNEKDNKLDKDVFSQIVNTFKSHIKNKPLVFQGVNETLKTLYNNYELYILTKGNFDEQKKKINRSGIKQYFHKEYIVPEKNDDTYISILKENKWKRTDCCMIGNSPKSDINPALRCGLYAIFISYPHTWKLDNEELNNNHPKLYKVKNFPEILQLLTKLFKS